MMIMGQEGGNLYDTSMLAHLVLSIVQQTILPFVKNFPTIQLVTNILFFIPSVLYMWYFLL